MSLFARLTRHKTVEQLQAEAETSSDFRRVMGICQLTAIRAFPDMDGDRSGDLLWLWHPAKQPGAADTIAMICRTLAAFILLLAGPAIADAQDSTVGMSGHGHGHITIPEDALYTVADVEFMQGMIAHHAQAIHMSKMAASHNADPRVTKLARKIEQSQVAEIRVMQGWLSRNGQAVPDTSSWRTMQMPGMLTAEQLAELDAATGTAFDRAYLTLMIQHHEGALQMVRDLLANPRAAQDVNVYVFANDVVSVQTAEIGAMQRMLAGLSGQ